MANVVGIDEFQPAAQGSGGQSTTNWREMASSRQDPLMQFDWDVTITGPDGINIEAELVEEIQVPLPKYDADSVIYQARKCYYAKFEDFGGTTIKFYEDNRMVTTQRLRAWQRRIKDDRGNYRVPNAYKGTIRVRPLDATQKVIAEIILHGVFPTQVPNLAFTSAGERVTLDTEFSVDSVEIVFHQEV